LKRRVKETLERTGQEGGLPPLSNQRGQPLPDLFFFSFCFLSGIVDEFRSVSSLTLSWSIKNSPKD
jgi:hypothetical protein